MANEDVANDKFLDLERFSSQLKTVFGAWEANLTELTKVQSPRDPAGQSRPVRDVLRDADALLDSLRRDASVLADALAAERRAAEAWENRVMLAIQEGRDDLARTALERTREHSDGAEWLEAERQFVESMCESLDQTIAKLRATLAST